MPLALLKYWREALLGVAACLLIAGAIYVRNALTERDKLRQENAVLAAQLKGAAAVQELTNKVADAISQIKIRSSVNVSRIESQPKPVFVDARPLPFIAGGVLQAVYSSNTSPGTAPPASSGGSPPPGQPAGGVLPERPGAP